MKTAIVLPAHNEAKVLAKTIQGIKKNIQNNTDIIVVDDGSSDRTKKIAEKYADIVLHHIKNRGYGAALSTGFEYARRKDYEQVVTFDSDGQHNPKNIQRTLDKLQDDCDVVIGSRFKNSKNQIPSKRKVILKLSNLLTFILFGILTSDSQSGFRAYNQKALNKIKLSSNQMEISSELFGEIKKHNLKLAETPIDIKYTKYSLSKGQKNSNAFNVLVKLLYKVFK